MPPPQHVVNQHPPQHAVNQHPPQHAVNQYPPQHAAVNQHPPQLKQAYMQNPPHVQQQFLVLAPGHLPPHQKSNLPTAQQILPLNDHNIALPTPNYEYSRIGPNNQGLLSPTTLQNKLKII